MRYKKKSVEVDATRWQKLGDHPAVTQHFSRVNPCWRCYESFDLHGWIETLDGGHIVCPGAYIVTNAKGENRPVGAYIFELTYEPIHE